MIGVAGVGSITTCQAEPNLRVAADEWHETEGAQVFADEVVALARESDHLLMC